ncbi:MAG: hypothetical protein V1659_00310 [Candidatus Woesearchaeota archaeon]
MARKKLRIGFYGVTGCAGCQLSVIFNEREILRLFNLIDVSAFPFIKEKNIEGEFDYVFIEGLAACNDDVAVLKELRQKAKKVVALGACACAGNIPAYRKYVSRKNYQHLIHEKTKRIQDVDPTPIDSHIAVDYFIPGCPPDKSEILKFIKEIVLGKEPRQHESPVCFECKINKNPCLLDEGKMCLGPVTRGGCNSVCTNSGFECWGCRGIMQDADIKLMIKVLKGKGFSGREIKQRMRSFTGLKIPQLQFIGVKK